MTTQSIPANRVELAAQPEPVQNITRDRAKDLTTNKVCKYMIAVGFAILLGLIITVFCGMGVGLLVTSSTILTGLLTKIILSCCASRHQSEPSIQEPDLEPAEQSSIQQPPVQQLNLDQARQIHPEGNVRQDLTDDQTRDLRNFTNKVLIAIYQKSLHFNNYFSLFRHLSNRFSGMDYSKLRLLSLEPVRYGNGIEGYEVIIDSETPNGWFRCYLPKARDDIHELPETVDSLQRIKKVTPFLSSYRIQKNYLASLGLPFQEMFPLQNALLIWDDELDLTQLKLASIRNVSYHYQYGSQEIDYDGYEMDFIAPKGSIRLYASPCGIAVNDESTVSRVRPRE